MATLSTERRLGIGDAMRRLGVSRARVKQLAAKGRIGELIAGRYLFSAAELSAFAKIPRLRGRPKSNAQHGLQQSSRKSL